MCVSSFELLHPYKTVIYTFPLLSLCLLTSTLRHSLLDSMFARRWHVEQLLYILFQRKWLFWLGKEFHRHSLSIDQILVKVVLHLCRRHLTIQSLIDWIVLERRESKDGKGGLGECGGNKLLNLFVATQLLMKVVCRKRQDGKATRLIESL